MTEENAEDIIESANQELSEAAEPPKTVEEFVAEVIDDPQVSRSAHQYLLEAIEHFGTRTVFERGEEKERYRFFDDPENDGEHAVLGNTDILNQFVEDLRVITNSDERMQKIILFNGPTATGKSELKRCIINGLREYSKTESGKRYTIDWNLSAMNKPTEGLGTYGEGNTSVDETEWFQSPVQVTPLSILPETTRTEMSENIGAAHLPIDIELDPFSQEAYDILKRHYEQQNVDDIFSSITDDTHFRIRRYTLDETQGIGVLTAEDDGGVKERLIGTWMPSMFQMLDSRGRKNPQAFSYDGVLAQGNGGVTVVEDATKHADVLAHLLNIPDEQHAKIDKQIGFDVDTVPIFISNPDLVDQHLKELESRSIPLKEIHGVDPLKAIKRRIFQYQFHYLTSLSDEVQLLRSEIKGQHSNIEDTNINEPMNLNGSEFAPHALEAAGMYNVVSRLSDEDLPSGLTLSDKALLFDRGYVDTPNGRFEYSDFGFQDDVADGTFGIPVTYTRDILSALAHSDEKSVYLPNDVLDAIVEGLSEAPVFGDHEEEQFDERVETVRKYIYRQQESDVIDAILAERKATESAVTEYIDNVYAWADEDTDEQEYDEMEMKIFEQQHLGTTEEDYDGALPNKDVLEMRENRIITPLNRYVWNERSEEYEISELELKNTTVISKLLGSYDWTDVFTTHENLNPVNWSSPAHNTPTAEVKTECVNNMVDEFGYTKESARRTSERVFKRRREEIIDIKERLNSSD